MALIKSDFLIENAMAHTDDGGGGGNRSPFEQKKREREKKRKKLAGKKRFFHLWRKQQFLIFFYVDKFISARFIPAAPSYPISSFISPLLCHQSGWAARARRLPRLKCL
jgi:hypothetical protein